MNEPQIISKSCKEDDHDWCHNRNYGECHCECRCHKERAELVRTKRVAPAVAVVEKSHNTIIHMIEKKRKLLETLEDSRPTPWTECYELEGEIRAFETAREQFMIARREVSELDLPGWIPS